MTKKIFIPAISLIALAVLFQNCSGPTAGSSASSAPANSKNNLGPVPSPTPSYQQKALTILHGSIGNSSVVTRFVMKVTGAGSSEVLACTNPTYNYSTACTKDSDFILLRTADNAWSYDAGTDTYSINQDVSARGFPNTEYFTKYKIPNGGTVENRWRPITFVDNSLGNGSIVTRVIQNVTGVGAAGLLGCTTLKSNAATSCVNGSEFVVVSNQEGWSYNSGTDAYAINLDVSKYSWPHVEFVTRYWLANGLRTEISFYPKR